MAVLICGGNGFHFVYQRFVFLSLLMVLPMGFLGVQGGCGKVILCVLVMEAVGRMLDKAVHEGRLLGFCVSDSAGRSSVVFHLLFAYDTLIFCDANIDQMLILCMMLIWFETVSGLKVSLGKSELVAVGVVHNIELLVAVLGL